MKSELYAHKGNFLVKEQAWRSLLTHVLAWKHCAFLWHFIKEKTVAMAIVLIWTPAQTVLWKTATPLLPYKAVQQMEKWMWQQRHKNRDQEPTQASFPDVSDSAHVIMYISPDFVVPVSSSTKWIGKLLFKRFCALRLRWERLKRSAVKEELHTVNHGSLT